MFQSLDGFALALAADGRFLYISETVSIYLGLSQVCYYYIYSSKSTLFSASVSIPAGGSGGCSSECMPLTYSSAAACLPFIMLAGGGGLRSGMAAAEAARCRGTTCLQSIGCLQVPGTWLTYSPCQRRTYTTLDQKIILLSSNHRFIGTITHNCTPGMTNRLGLPYKFLIANDSFRSTFVTSSFDACRKRSSITNPWNFIRNLQELVNRRGVVFFFATTMPDRMWLKKLTFAFSASNVAFFCRFCIPIESRKKNLFTKETTFVPSTPRRRHAS